MERFWLNSKNKFLGDTTLNMTYWQAESSNQCLLVNGAHKQGQAEYKTRTDATRIWIQARNHFFPHYPITDKQK